MAKLETINYKRSLNQEGEVFSESVEIGVNVLGDESPLTDEQKIQMDTVLSNIRQSVKEHMDSWHAPKPTRVTKSYPIASATPVEEKKVTKVDAPITEGQVTALKSWCNNPKMRALIQNMMDDFDIAEFEDLNRGQASEILTACGVLADTSRGKK